MDHLIWQKLPWDEFEHFDKDGSHPPNKWCGFGVINVWSTLAIKWPMLSPMSHAFCNIMVLKLLPIIHNYATNEIQIAIFMDQRFWVGIMLIKWVFCFDFAVVVIQITKWGKHAMKGSKKSAQLWSRNFSF